MARSGGAAHGHVDGGTMAGMTPRAAVLGLLLMSAACTAEEPVAGSASDAAAFDAAAGDGPAGDAAAEASDATPSGPDAGATASPDAGSDAGTPPRSHRAGAIPVGIENVNDSPLEAARYRTLLRF